MTSPGLRDEDRGRLLARLPDVPRWCETRAALLEGECDLFGSDRDCILRVEHQRLLSVVGEPGEPVLRQATAELEGEWTLICALDAGERWSGLLPGWSLEPAVLHERTEPRAVAAPAAPARVERVRGPSPALLDPLPARLRREVRVAAERYPLFAAWVEGRAVAFCSAGSITETLWDISVETLPDYRRLGLAAACVALAVEHMAGLGRRPVWGAVESNEPSLRLAAKLGFRPVDRLAVLEKYE